MTYRQWLVGIGHRVSNLRRNTETIMARHKVSLFDGPIR